MEVSVTDSTNRTHVTSKLTLAGSIILSHWQVDCHREEFATDKISLADRVMSLLSTPSWPWGPEWQRRSSLSFTTSVRSWLIDDWQVSLAFSEWCQWFDEVTGGSSHWQLISFSGVHSLAGCKKNRLNWKLFLQKTFTHACAIEDDQEEMIDNEKWCVQYLRGSDFELGNLKERNTWLWIDGVVGRWKDWKWMFYEAREIFGFEKKVGSWDKRK